MLGLLIGLLIAAWTIFVKGGAEGAGIISATGFMWYWYWIWTVVQALILALISLGIIGAAGIGAAGSTGSKLAGLAGAALGGGLSLLMWAMFAIRSVMVLGGTYLMMTAGTAEMALSDFNLLRLIGGGVLLLAALVLIRNRSSSSSRS